MILNLNVLSPTAPSYDDPVLDCALGNIVIFLESPLVREPMAILAPPTTAKGLPVTAPAPATATPDIVPTIEFKVFAVFSLLILSTFVELIGICIPS